MIIVPSQPTDLTIDIQSDTSLLLTWKRPIYSGGKLMKYAVLYRTSTENWIRKELNTNLKNKTVTTTVNGLKRKARYEVKVCVKYRLNSLPFPSLNNFL